MAKKKIVEPPRQGRPPNGETAFTDRMHLRCLEEEKRAWNLQAGVAGVDLGTWAREILNAASSDARKIMARKKAS